MSKKEITMRFHAVGLVAMLAFALLAAPLAAEAPQPTPETAAAVRLPLVPQDATMTRIRRAQERLTALGFTPGPVDGVLGPRMRTALQQFQRANRLPITEEVDGVTWLFLSGRSQRPADFGRHP